MVPLTSLMYACTGALPLQQIYDIYFVSPVAMAQLQTAASLVVSDLVFQSEINSVPAQYSVLQVVLPESVLA